MLGVNDAVPPEQMVCVPPEYICGGCPTVKLIIVELEQPL